MDMLDAPTPPFNAEPTVPAAPEKRPGVWSGLGTVALYFLLQAGASIVVALVIGIVLGMQGAIKAAKDHVKFDPHVIAKAMQTDPGVMVLLTVATLVLATIATIALVRKFWPAQWSRAELPGFGFTAPQRKRDYAIAILLAIMVLVAGNLLTKWLAGHHPLNQDVSVMAAKVSFGWKIALALTVVVAAPLVEEIVFRGVLLSGLARRLPVGWAVFISALLFGAIHLPDFKFAWYPVPGLVMLGLAAGWLRVRSKSLWPAITLHATNNFVAVVMWFVVTGVH